MRVTAAASAAGTNRKRGRNPKFSSCVCNGKKEEEEGYFGQTRLDWTGLTASLSPLYLVGPGKIASFTFPFSSSSFFSDRR